MFIPILLPDKIKVRKLDKILTSLGLNDFLVERNSGKVLLFDYEPERFWDLLRDNTVLFFKAGMQFIIPTNRFFRRLIQNSNFKGYKIVDIDAEDIDESVKYDFENEQCTEDDFVDYVFSNSTNVKAVTLKRDREKVQVFSDGTLNFISIGIQEVSKESIEDFLLILERSVVGERAI